MKTTIVKTGLMNKTAVSSLYLSYT